MDSYITYISEQLKTLTSIPSPSGYTREVSDYVSRTLTEMGYQPELSQKGNVCVNCGGNGNPLLLAAHLDTLGAMVRSVKSDGRIHPTTLGGHLWLSLIHI